MFNTITTIYYELLKLVIALVFELYAIGTSETFIFFGF